MIQELTLPTYHLQDTSGLRLGLRACVNDSMDALQEIQGALLLKVCVEAGISDDQ